MNSDNSDKCWNESKNNISKLGLFSLSSAWFGFAFSLDPDRGSTAVTKIIILILLRGIIKSFISMSELMRPQEKLLCLYKSGLRSFLTGNFSGKTLYYLIKVKD